jgi:hypothetical protein
VTHYAPHSTVTHLGGVGSGKTQGAAFSFMTDLLTKPHFLGLNTSISSFQANLLFEMLQPYIERPLVARFIKDVKRRPYPSIETIFGSKLSCMTSGYQATNIRGSEFDRINFDEGGYEYDEETYVALRSRLRGRRADGTIRDAQLVITTTPTDSPPLRQRWNKGDAETDVYDPYGYSSVRSTLFDNFHVTARQREAIIADYTEEMVQQEIYALFPDWGISEFPTGQIRACEDRWLNDWMETEAGGEGDLAKPWKVELPRLGVTKWVAPVEPGRIYIAAGDPGTGNPPRRNAGTVMVWDVTQKPYTMVYMDWVTGNGSYIPWFNSFKFAMEYYQPLYQGIDATGTQKAIDELVFEREGLKVDGINFTRDKFTMINSLKMIFQYGDIRFPFIKGLHNQLGFYKLPDDDIAQDLVSAMMVAAYLTRYLPAQVTKRQDTVVKVQTASHYARRQLVKRGMRSKYRSKTQRRTAIRG